MDARAIAASAVLIGGAALAIALLRGGGATPLDVAANVTSRSPTPASGGRVLDAAPTARRVDPVETVGDVWLDDDPVSGPADHAPVARSSTPRGKLWNDAIGANPPKLSDYRPLPELLYEAGRGSTRVKRLRAYREALSVYGVHRMTQGGASIAAQLVADLLALHANESDSSLRQRALDLLAKCVPPQLADTVMDRAGERAQNGTTESERGGAIALLGRYAAPEIERKYVWYAPAGVARGDVRPMATAFRSRALDRLMSLDAAGPSESDRQAIADAIAGAGPLAAATAK